MNRRGFITGMGGILLVGAAPAIVRADSLMKIVPRDTVLIHKTSAVGVSTYLDVGSYDVTIGAGPSYAMERTWAEFELARTMWRTALFQADAAGGAGD